MAKKVTKTFMVNLKLNTEKGGAWLAHVSVITPLEDGFNSIADSQAISDEAAWKNASAAKRWIKTKVQEMTPRKSVKLHAIAFDANEKPTAFTGSLDFKA